MDSESKKSLDITLLARAGKAQVPLHVNKASNLVIWGPYLRI